MDFKRHFVKITFSKMSDIMLEFPIDLKFGLLKLLFIYQT